MKWFQKPPKPEFNLSHPDIAPQIEVAFTAGGKKYYRFKEEKLIPVGRYKYINAYLKEADLRMTIDTLRNYVNDFKAILNGGAKKNNINIGELWKLVYNLETRVNLAFEPATVERLASVVYFDDSEDLSTYNKKHGDDKIWFWTMNMVFDFFLTRPIAELFGLKGISTESLEVYIQGTQQIIQDLTEDQQKQSSENSSENGKTHL
jgi:hypothetical protein